MKFSLVLALAIAMAMPVLSSASTLTWNFLNDVPGNSSGVAATSPHSFTDTQGDSTTIVASVVFGPANAKLYEKKGGGDENGLGIYGLDDNEIDTRSEVKLDLNSLLALNPASIAVSLGSVQSGEGGFIQYGNTFYGFGVYDESSHVLNLSSLSKNGGFINVFATGGNVLIGSITATPGAQAPEPANLALAGAGLIALGCIARRKFAQQKQ